MRRPCQDVERTIPSRLLHRQALPVACVSHIGRFTLRSPHHAATRIDREDDRAPGIRTHRQNDLHYRPLLDDGLERLLEHELTVEDGTLSVSPNAFACDNSGSYYTPNALVGLILDQTVER